ncbi:MAG TPA: HemK family protein methyltransferase, partial [Planctomycetota bacterium]|nr:HemK family protein methyltransferase [Planctomycetota bacterium]
FEALRRRLESGAAFLPDLPEETPDATARALWLLAAGEPVSAHGASGRELPALSAEQRARLEQLVERRLRGVPLAHLTQRQKFLGLEMLCSADALVPRKETELLARAAIEHAGAAIAERGRCLVVDVCTGGGNVALAIAHRAPAARVHGADLSEPAVALAKRNARQLELEGRVEFRAGDLLEPFRTAEFLGQVDVLTCNPPYISSGKVASLPAQISSHEPRLAFDGGPFGIGILVRLLSAAPEFVRPGGCLVFEVGHGQGPAITKRMQANPVFRDVVPLRDASGAVRAFSVRL